MDTNSPEQRKAQSVDQQRTLVTILDEQRTMMERAERSHHRHVRWMWLSNVVLRPVTMWVYERIADLLSS
jgi:hypothetical protein